MVQPSRPTFTPSPYSDYVVSSQARPLVSATATNANNLWIPIIWSPADFPAELFEAAISQLIHHPEYNSTLILRSETISETTFNFARAIPTLSGFRIVRSIKRRLLPRRPRRDTGLEQHCTLFAVEGEGDAAGDTPSTLVLTPILPESGTLPYYHPRVSHLAFRYIEQEPPILRIEVIPLPDTPMDMNSRLYRTCLALLEALHRYGWGAMTNYKKRVQHDCIVSRETYQDLYLVMRERHKHLVDTWQESTDPLKHVFEDIGIATFLMLLWKDMHAGFAPPNDTGLEMLEPWRGWPRPPAGFLDLGCGNGLLTHILTAEGYEGVGIDLRARTSWSHYPSSTQTQLRVEALNPTTLDDPGVISAHPLLHAGVFIIGNHADELTPWVPVLATLCSASGYLSIPCCAWSFDTRYQRSRDDVYSIPDGFIDSLNLGGYGSNTSSYSSYRIWLASLSLHLGWKVECEMLRIPSTRNWAIVGRKRISEGNEGAKYRNRAEQIVRSVRERAMFKTRIPEGRDRSGH